MPLLDQWYREHLAEIADPASQIDIKTLPAETYDSLTPFNYVPYGSLAILFDHYFVRTAVTAEREGYDVWVIAAGQDPGLARARALTSIPVLGYGEVSFFYSAMMGHRFGVLGFMEGLREPIVENIHRYGLASRLSSYEMVADGHTAVEQAVHGEFGRFIEIYTTAAQQAAAKGAQVLIPAEGIPAEILWHLRIRELADLPVLDPMGLLVKQAELTVAAHTSTIAARSSAGYWFRRADPAVVEHLEKVFLT
jgi:allantoin racemase